MVWMRGISERVCRHRRITIGRCSIWLRMSQLWSFEPTEAERQKTVFVEEIGGLQESASASAIMNESNKNNDERVTEGRVRRGGP